MTSSKLKFVPRDNQRIALNHAYPNDKVALFLDMGLGKTVTTLALIRRLLFQDFEVSKVLIIAPKKVSENTWTDEVDKWQGMQKLSMSLILGTPKKRKLAMHSESFIHIVNVENIVWLITELKGKWPYDMLVIDESSMFKDPSTQRFKTLASVAHRSDRVVLLSGTPAPNGVKDLWAQMYLLDQGERLGKTYRSFEREYLTVNPYTRVVQDRSEEHKNKVYSLTKDLCISQKSEDWLDLPKLLEINRFARVSENVLRRYTDFRMQRVLELINDSDEDEPLSTANISALNMKLRQFANGAVYYDVFNEDTEEVQKRVHLEHDDKLDVLEEIVKEANGSVLVFYQFRHDIGRIQKRLSKHKPRLFSKGKQGRQDLKDWNARKIKVLIAHAASAGHGLNMQYGGNTIVCFGLDYSLERYQQAIKRLHRPAQQLPVFVYRLLTKGTIDEKIIEVIDKKAKKQDGLLAELKAGLEDLRKKGMDTSLVKF